METTTDARLVKSYATNFSNGRLPHWLKPRVDGIFAGSSITPASASVSGGMLLTTPAASTASGVVGEEFDMTKVTRARMEVVVAGGGSATLGMSVGFHTAANDRGVRILRNANNPTVLIQSFQPADMYFGTSFRSWETADRRMLIGLEVFPNEKLNGANIRIVRLLIDGEIHTQQTITEADMPLDTMVMPRFQISGSSVSTGDSRVLHSLEVKRYYT